MILNKDMYVPVLGWRQGEYQALWRLDTQVQDKIVPLICIPDVEFDFADREPRRTLDEHVKPFVRRFNIKWGNRPAWIALHDNIAMGRMHNGNHVFDYIFDGLRSHHAYVAPVLSLTSDSDMITAAARAISRDKYGVAIRLRLENLMTYKPINKIKKIVNDLSLPFEEVDLIIDLRAPNFEPYQIFIKTLLSTLNRLGDISSFRNFVIASTAIPESFSKIARGIDKIARDDWLFYKALLASLPSGMQHPIYSDYTVIHPEFTPMDMRMVKPAAKIVYTNNDFWTTCKGRSFRDNPKQMHDYCKTIMNDHRFQFRGTDFSFGDDYIAKCADQKEGPSNLSMWKCITINHHITTVVDDLAKMYARP